MKLIKPNFKNSILNVSSTLSNYLGNKKDIAEIKILNKFLNKKYKNIVFICFDGLGMYPLKQNLRKDSFLRKNVKKTITSVFPSTTTNATSTLSSANYPSEHGLFGWSLYLDELDRAVDIYLKTDSYTGELVDKDVIDEKFKFDYYFEQSKGEYEISSVFPPYVKPAKNNYAFNNIEEMFGYLNKICAKPGKQFIYSYCGEPDHTMHEFGVNSNQSKEIIDLINKQVEEFSKTNKDTLIIITADHGHIDIKKYVDIYKDEKLLATLETPLYLEPRATSFRVKRNNEKEFLQEMKKYRKLVKLYRLDDLVAKEYFGPKTEKLNILGNYIAIAKNYDTILLFNEDKPRFKGHHTSLTKREMILPLIIIG